MLKLLCTAYLNSITNRFKKYPISVLLCFKLNGKTDDDHIARPFIIDRCMANGLE